MSAALSVLATFLIIGLVLVAAVAIIAALVVLVCVIIGVVRYAVSPQYQADLQSAQESED